MLKENLIMAWDNIKNSKMRSFLTSLGIVIGVSAVIALITIVQSATGEMMSQFESMGTDKISVQVSGNVLKSGLTSTDLENLAKIDNVSGVAPSVSSNRFGRKAGQSFLTKYRSWGKNEKYFEEDDTELTQGRKLTAADMDGHTYTCVIDQDIQASHVSERKPHRTDDHDQRSGI